MPTLTISTRSQVTISPAGRSSLSISTARAVVALGLGGNPGPRGLQGATGTIDVTPYDNQTEGIFIANPPEDGEPRLLLRISDDGSARTITFDSDFRGVIAALPSITTAGKVMYLGFIRNTDAGTYDLIAIGNQI